VTKAIARFSTPSDSRASGAMGDEKWVPNFGVAAPASMLPSGRTMAEVCAEHGGSAALAEAIVSVKKEQADE